MGAEISQVRQEADHFIKVSEISKKKKEKKKNKLKEGNSVSVVNEADDVTASRTKEDPLKHSYLFKQKDTETEIQRKKTKKEKDEEFKRKIALKKKSKEKKKLAKLKNRKPEDDFLESVFVGSSKWIPYVYYLY